MNTDLVVFTTRQGEYLAEIDGAVIPIVNRRLKGRWFARSPRGAEIDVTHHIHSPASLARLLRTMLATEGEQE
jgi:hypothetical protein